MMTMMQTTSIRQATSIIQATRLSMVQSAHIAQRMFTLRLDLVENIHGMKYMPKAECPNCSKKLKPLEILKGFNDDPYDFDTTCPGCKHRFSARLVANFRNGGTAELPFYCAIQTLNGLHDKDTLSYEDLKKSYGALFHSAVVHFGSITAAFGRLSIDYPMNERIAWKDKVSGFLGLIPDGVIANVVCVSKYAIQKLRRDLGIKGFSHRKLLED